VTQESLLTSWLPASTKDLLAAIDHLDRLNSWVRAKDAHCDRSCSEVIYFLKRVAIRQAHQAGIASHRIIFVTVTCRGCHGTGKFDSWYSSDGYGPNCRKCDATGKHTLTFVESTIADRLRWHSPYMSADHFGLKYEDRVEVTDWKPLAEGRPLKPAEVAENLNFIEDFFTERPRWKRSVYYDDYSSHAEVDDFASYKVWVGETPANLCRVCGAVDAEMYGAKLCVSASRITWSEHVCKSCEGIWRSKIWDRLKLLPVPADLISPPSIQEWIRCHRPTLSAVKS